jgi:hypothetical protein
MGSCAPRTTIATRTSFSSDDALTCEKEFFSFYRKEGAGEHCESGARLLFHQRAFDWLDERLQTAAPA